VRATLTAHGWTADYRVGGDQHTADAAAVPGDWYVYDVAPIGGGVLVLWVSETRTPPVFVPPSTDPRPVPAHPGK
jgi:hypothetical protein